MAKWWPLSDLPHLAFDHYDIMQDAIKVYKKTISARLVG
jgi:8-oxo-dGTP diphosphatase